MSKMKVEMETPVYDFVQSYIQKKSVRFHMPGHKGKDFLGCESKDITEIEGADVLSESDGILGISQKNAARLFQAGSTFYSTEGSSLSIKAMLAAALMDWKRQKQESEQKKKGICLQKRPWILSARNVHRAMIDGCALLDLDVEFIPCKNSNGICSTVIERKEVEKVLCAAEERPIGVYLTSPDYLGAQSNISEIASICHQYQVPLLVDNAHGAYLAFLQESRHPIALGADICCDSAHKTLPVLTGGGYLHLSAENVERYGPYIRKAMALFGSTSPSYLVLQSLDLCNRYLDGNYRTRLEECVEMVKVMREKMCRQGISVLPSEPLKLVIDAGASGYSGYEISQEMREFVMEGQEGKRDGMECEYADHQYVVLMVTPENQEDDFGCLNQWIKETRLRNRRKALDKMPVIPEKAAERKMTIRQAVLSDSEMVSVDKAVGRTLAQETVSCPPAIPIGISGEEVDREMADLFRFYGIREVSVVSCIV